MNAKIALWLSWAFFVGAAFGSWAWAQPRGPETIPGCIYNATPPSLSDKQSVSLQCDVNGKLKVTTS